MRGFDDVFWVPHSRYAEIKQEVVEAHSELQVLASSPETGVHLLASHDCRQLFITDTQNMIPKRLIMSLSGIWAPGSTPKCPKIII